MYVLKCTRFKIKTPKVSVSSSDNNVNFNIFLKIQVLWHVKKYYYNKFKIFIKWTK